MRKEDAYKKLIEHAREFTGVDVSMTRRRTKEIVRVKSAIMKILNEYYGMNLVEIGRMFRMHHATIIHHRDDHSSRYLYEPEYADLYDHLLRITLEDVNSFSAEQVITLMKSAMSV